MINYFKTPFDSEVLPGESITCTHAGVNYTATVKRDDDSHLNDDDCHSINIEVTGCTPEQHAKSMQARQAWFDDEWFYCGIVISAERNGWRKDYLSSLWSIEANYPDSDNSYLLTAANELMVEAIEHVALSLT